MSVRAIIGSREPHQFMAQERSMIANLCRRYHRHLRSVIFRIGRHTGPGQPHAELRGYRSCPPENFARAAQRDSMKRKQFLKGIDHLRRRCHSGLQKPDNGTETLIIGDVGILQLKCSNIAQSRYVVEIRQSGLELQACRWSCRRRRRCQSPILKSSFLTITTRACS